VFAYITRRLLSTIPLMMLALYVVHVGVSLTTNPRAEFILCRPQCQAGYDRITEVYNLDVNVFIRPFYWFADAFRGDFGESSTIGEPVIDVLMNRGWNTMLIAVPAFIVSAIFALLLSVYSAKNQYSKGDYFFTGLSFIGLALPSFVLALILQLIFGVKLDDWFGIKPFNTGRKTDTNFLELIRDVTLPATSLAILFISADYIRTARAKGLSERTVVWKHALRNGLIPLVTLWALNFAALLGGSIVTETIFSWPGLGPALINGLGGADLDLVLAIVFFIGVVTVFFNLVADVMYGVLDPRIRLD
jgi:peptide/nickel transport system permease protein